MVEALLDLTMSTDDRHGGMERVNELAFFLFATIDIAEQESSRRRMLIYIGRYGKQPWGSLDDLPVREVIQRHKAISELVGRESGDAEEG